MTITEAPRGTVHRFSDRQHARAVGYLIGNVDCLESGMHEPFVRDWPGEDGTVYVEVYKMTPSGQRVDDSIETATVVALIESLDNEVGLTITDLESLSAHDRYVAWTAIGMYLGVAPCTTLRSVS